MKDLRETETILRSRGVRPTPNRLLIADALLGASRPMSMTDLEIGLESVDKSSIFRTLAHFVEKGLVHTIDDGTGAVKYELCHGHEECTVEDQHLHFYCEKCGATICLEDIPIPRPALPEGYDVHSVNYVVKGLCPKCSS